LKCGYGPNATDRASVAKARNQHLQRRIEIARGGSGSSVMRRNTASTAAGESACEVVLASASGTAGSKLDGVEQFDAERRPPERVGPEHVIHKIPMNGKFYWKRTFR